MKLILLTKAVKLAGKISTALTGNNKTTQATGPSSSLAQLGRHSSTVGVNERYQT